MATSEVQGRWVVVAGLRLWAAGSVHDEAAVELLTSLGGRFVSNARPWVRPCQRPGWYWLDPEALVGYVGRLSPHQVRVLALVGALLSGHLRITPTTAPAAIPAPAHSVSIAQAVARVELGRAAA